MSPLNIKDAASTITLKSSSRVCWCSLSLRLTFILFFFTSGLLKYFQVKLNSFEINKLRSSQFQTFHSSRCYSESNYYYSLLTLDRGCVSVEVCVEFLTFQVYIFDILKNILWLSNMWKANSNNFFLKKFR